MTPFPHRRFIRKKKPPYPMAPQPEWGRIEKGRAESGKFAKPGPRQMYLPFSPVDNSVEKNPPLNVVRQTLTGHNQGMREGGNTEMGKSHRVAMAQALLTELAEAYQRHGDTDGTRRLQAMVARMVAELLYR